jgi:hypothetical protein
MREKSNENTSRFSSSTSMKVLPRTGEATGTGWPTMGAGTPMPIHDSRKKTVATTNVG